MAEVMEILKSQSNSFRKNLAFSLLSEIEFIRLKKVLKNALVASYVNQSVLPQKYPAAKAIAIDHISSIRLSPEKIVKSKETKNPNKHIIVTIGSLIPIKDHRTLITAFDSYSNILLILSL